MRNEFLAMGVSKESGEIRQTYNLGSLRVSLSHMPSNETQTMHKHFLVSEAVHVLAGQIEIHYGTNWQTVKKDHLVLFDLNEFHNIRTLAPEKFFLDEGPISNLAAITVVYKWIQPHFQVHPSEIGFVMENDWFDTQDGNNSKRMQTSPLLRLGQHQQEHFWSIVLRNYRRQS